ncbi:MAG: AAA family ATPase [Fibrobacteres bacterium]|nr:AAA family ATPase [Fibrobacterota bacterium]
MTRKPRKLPYAVANFEQIHEEGYSFVDKTAYIRELENFQVPVFLRPRRFGKTLWCSTLECYYDILRKERFQELFGGLDIGRDPTGLQNKFMVLRFNFSQVQVSDQLPALEQSFRTICHAALQPFCEKYAGHLGNLVIDESKSVSDNFSRILAQAAKPGVPPIYLIIDEYDNFSNQYVTSGRDDLYQNLTTGDSFFRTFFKVVKAGCESRAIGKVFITGVLPITMDDLTSGFNIAEIVTLAPELHGMLGFTQAEVDRYLGQVYEDYAMDRASFDSTRELVRSWYNGYKFLPDTEETLYNSTILTYFLKTFALRKAYPEDMVDPNVKTDVSWIERLGFGSGTPLDLMQDLLRGDGLAYDARQLRDKFNMSRFFQREHFAMSLFFLGMLTVKDRRYLAFPNQTLASIFADYYSQLARIEVSRGYDGYFADFRQDLDLGRLFGGFWKVYMGQIPAQAFDKINENFIRTTFFELCTRYLLLDFSFGIEVNHASGRADWEMLGRPETEYRNQKWIVEFKHFPNSSGKTPSDFTVPDPQAVAQAEGYKRDTLAQFPQYQVRTAVCMTVGNQGFRWFDLEAGGEG